MTSPKNFDAFWVVTVKGTLLTVRMAVPDVLANWLSPAKLALTPAVYVPALMPARLTFVRVAMPEALVVAVPMTVPFSEKVAVLPATTEPFRTLVSLADKLTVPK